GSAFAAAGEVTSAALLMAATAAVLAAASWVVGRKPSRSPRSDLWVSRLLLCGAVVLAFLAGLRLAFGLSEALVPPVAAGVAVLAAGNLVATVYARRAGASVTSILVASSATVAMSVAAWVLAARSDEAALALPSLALLAGLITAVVDEFAPGGGEASRKASGVAAIAAPAAFAIVVADAPELSSYLVAAVAIGLLSLALPEPLRRSLRHAAYIGGAAIAAVGGLIALSALPDLWWDFGFPGLLTWEVPIVLALLALSAALVPERRRFDVVAFTLTFAGIAASLLLWHGEPSRLDAIPAVGFALAAVIALVGAMASATLDGRCASWCLLAVWLPLTASAIGSSTMDASSSQIGFGLVAAAAAMLAVAAGAPRRSRPDRVLAAVLAHVLAGVTAGAMVVGEWFGQLISGSDSSFYLPAALGVYTLALAGVALMAPVKKTPYAVAALCTGTAAWWALLAALEAETLEAFTGPPAAVLFAFGLWRLLRRPETGSWAQLAAPIAVGIGPSLLLALAEDETARRVGVGAAALAVVVAGLARRWQAPLVLGSIALLALTANELALVWHAIPQWIPPAVGGAVLIGLGATFERRRRDLVRLRAGLKAMR
ncbi:SCO7613 C-terminal domain-containing membrane protein, partial [Glycomyces tenuis]